MKPKNRLVCHPEILSHARSRREPSAECSACDAFRTQRLGLDTSLFTASRPLALKDGQARLCALNASHVGDSTAACLPRPERRGRQRQDYADEKPPRRKHDLANERHAVLKPKREGVELLSHVGDSTARVPVRPRPYRRLVPALA